VGPTDAELLGKFSAFYETRRFINIFRTCKISGFHGGDYEEWRLLGCYAV
jgi:hypothetical protein